jgi:hypothetical protein
MPPYGIGLGPATWPRTPLLLSPVIGYADNYPAATDRPSTPVVPTFMYGAT